MHAANRIRLPAEWEHQDAILLAWPHKQSDWAALLGTVEIQFVELTSAIAQQQQLIIIARDPEHRQRIQSLLSGSDAVTDQIHYCTIPTNDSWARDFGPISIIHGESAEPLDFQFNGWGKRYPHTLDNAVNRQLASADLFVGTLKTQSLILEGGSIESDGQGTLLTTPKCLLNPNRNGMDKTAIEHELKSRLGVNRVLWLNNGYLAGDDTDSHIDNLARFVNPHTIIYLRCDDPEDEHYQALQKMEMELKAFRTAEGNPFTLIPLPLPQAVFSQTNGHRLPASYLNFLITNHAVLVPQFNDPADQTAIDTLSQCFPERTITGINSLAFIEQHGGIHCLTMQLSKGLLNQ